AFINIPPDSDPLLRFISNVIMRRGRRAMADKVVARTLMHIHALTRSPPLPIVRLAVALASPALRVDSHKEGAKVFQRPRPLGERARTGTAIRWILKSAKRHRSRTVEQNLALELLSIIQCRNSPKDNPVLKMKGDLHAFAVANR
ncbi:ribosomal protein S7, partial [Fistulina hepatica ATCC 64428]